MQLLAALDSSKVDLNQSTDVEEEASFPTKRVFYFTQSQAGLEIKELQVNFFKLDQRLSIPAEEGWDQYLFFVVDKQKAVWTWQAMSVVASNSLLAQIFSRGLFWKQGIQQLDNTIGIQQFFCQQLPFGLLFKLLQNFRPANPRVKELLSEGLCRSLKRVKAEDVPKRFLYQYCQKKLVLKAQIVKILERTTCSQEEEKFYINYIRESGLGAVCSPRLRLLQLAFTFVQNSVYQSLESIRLISADGFSSQLFQSWALKQLLTQIQLTLQSQKSINCIKKLLEAFEKTQIFSDMIEIAGQRLLRFHETEIGQKLYLQLLEYLKKHGCRQLALLLKACFRICQFRVSPSFLQVSTLNLQDCQIPLAYFSSVQLIELLNFHQNNTQNAQLLLGLLARKIRLDDISILTPKQRQKLLLELLKSKKIQIIYQGIKQGKLFGQQVSLISLNLDDELFLKFKKLGTVFDRTCNPKSYQVFKNKNDKKFKTFLTTSLFSFVSYLLSSVKFISSQSFTLSVFLFCSAYLGYNSLFKPSEPIYPDQLPQPVPTAQGESSGSEAIFVVGQQNPVIWQDHYKSLLPMIEQNGSQNRAYTHSENSQICSAQFQQIPVEKRRAASSPTQSHPAQTRPTNSKSTTSKPAVIHFDIDQKKQENLSESILDFYDHKEKESNISRILLNILARFFE